MDKTFFHPTFRLSKLVIILADILKEGKDFKKNINYLFWIRLSKCYWSHAGLRFRSVKDQLGVRNMNEVMKINANCLHFPYYRDD